MSAVFFCLCDIMTLDNRMKKIRPENDPAYLKLYYEFRRKITDGIFSYGAKLPSKRVTADTYQLSVITVEHAYSLLEEEGYIEARERSGYYVSYRSEDLYQSGQAVFHSAAKEETDDENFPFSVLSKAARKVLSEYGEQLLVRTDGQGALILREAIAAYLARSRDIRVSPQQIVIGSGAEYLYTIITSLLGRHRIYGIEDPSYEKIRKIYRAEGVRLDKLKMGTNGIRTSELARTPASVLHVTPYRSLPTNTTADASKRREYVEWAETKNAYIVEDDYASEYSILSKPEQTLFSMSPESHVLYLNTFTETIAPSVRVGYLILPAEKTEEFLEKISFRSCTVSSLTQYVIAELLNSGSFERHINRVRRKRRREQK